MGPYPLERNTVPSKHYGWHKRWQLDLPGLTATHETGFRVRYEVGGMLVRVVPMNVDETVAALEPKHGHNAPEMVRRFIKEALQLHHHATQRRHE